MADPNSTMATHLGGNLVVSDCKVAQNLAVGGQGVAGGNGGNGLGGGLYNDGSSAVGVGSLTITGSTIIRNDADGGSGGAAAAPAKAPAAASISRPGGIVCVDATTVVKQNHASSSNDDIFGVYTIFC